MMESTEEIKTVFCCQVCGDVATCYRLYGAKSVCYSCRIFFRRAVKSSQTFICKKGSTLPCTFDKFTRNHCKSCRYAACVSVGMVAHLVDSCRPHRTPQTALVKPKSVMRPLEQTQMTSFTFEKELAIRKFESICDDLFFNSAEHYSLIEIDKHLLPQIREKKFLISTPPDLVNRSSTFSRCAINEFLKYFLPSLSEGSCDAISRNVNLTVQGIYICAFSAFNCQTLLEQYRKSAIISSDKFWTHYKELFPDIENLSPVPLQNYDIFSSPYAQRFEDEQFVEKICEKFSRLLNGDLECGKLVYLLALVSPVKLDLEPQDVDLLKQFQKKISIMIYNYLMSSSELDNTIVLEKMYQLASLLEDLNRCGEIFQDGLINHGAGHCEEIENIVIDVL